jgi:hypothetical protein
MSTDKRDETERDEIEEIEEITEETEETEAGDSVPDVPEAETETEDYYEPDDESELPVIPETLRDSDSSDEQAEKPQSSEMTDLQKAIKAKSLYKTIALSLVTLLIIAGGIIAYWQYDEWQKRRAEAESNASRPDGYIMTVNDEKISVRDFELAILLNAMYQQSGHDPKQSAVDALIHYSILDIMARDKNVVLTDAEKSHVRTEMDDIKEWLIFEEMEMPAVSDERFEFLLGYMLTNAIPFRLLDAVAAERDHIIDEEQFAAEFEIYRENDRLFKYIITESEETAKEAGNAVNSGDMTPEEAIIQYSDAYDELRGIDKLELSEVGFPEEERNIIMALEPGEASVPVDIGDEVYAVFIGATAGETEERFRDIYEYYQKIQLFNAEFAMYESDAKIEVDQEILDNFDMDEFWEWLWGE